MMNPQRQKYTQSGIQKIFSETPSKYELINHILTFGMDIIWRRKAARIAASAGGTTWLDVCTGTGEMAVYLRRLAGNDVSVFATDFSLPMLNMAVAKPEGASIRFAISDVRNLPFPDNTFDLITISFATRNINVNRESLLRALKELHRVLKPSGTFVNLETSQPQSQIIKKIFHTYIKLFVSPVGKAISTSKTAYKYLSHTIPCFYEPAEFADIIEEAGFNHVSIKKMLMGTAAIHIGKK